MQITPNTHTVHAMRSYKHVFLCICCVLIGMLLYAQYNATFKAVGCGNAQIIRNAHPPSQNMQTKSATELVSEIKTGGDFVLPGGTQLDASICASVPESAACEAAVLWARSPVLGSGCVKLLLDVGSNIGVHARFLFEPNLYKPRHPYDNVLDSEFGVSRTQRREEICVLAFEPNPTHRKRHQQLATAYARQGWKYRAFYTAVGGRTMSSGSADNLVFFLNDNGSNNDWGFSIKNMKGGNITKRVHVPVMDLSMFVFEHIAKAAVRPAKVLMKMDIEGSEFSVLPHMLTTGSFNHIDAMTVEFHIWPNGFAFQANTLKISQASCREFANVFPFMLKSQYNTTFRTVDDENFRFDGKPLPA